jgi:hypothetical protein
VLGVVVVVVVVSLTLVTLVAGNAADVAGSVVDVAAGADAAVEMAVVAHRPVDSTYCAFGCNSVCMTFCGTISTHSIFPGWRIYGLSLRFSRNNEGAPDAPKFRTQFQLSNLISG